MYGRAVFILHKTRQILRFSGGHKKSIWSTFKRKSVPGVENAERLDHCLSLRGLVIKSADS